MGFDGPVRPTKDSRWRSTGLDRDGCVEFLGEMAAAARQCLLGFRRAAPQPLPLLSTRAPSPAPSRRRGARMASSGDDAPPLSTTVAVLGAGEPVCVVAAPGLTEADFTSAVESSLFRQWLKNLQEEKGVLTYGRLNLRQILIQVSHATVTPC